MFTIFIGKMMKRNNIFLYWLLQTTWGLIGTLIGFLFCVLLLGLNRAKLSMYKQAIHVRVKGFPGGVSLGGFIFTDEDAYGLSIRGHEWGHTIQNIIFGPLFMFIIGLPSIIRCAFYNYYYDNNREKYNKLPDYDSVWFEGWATRLGNKYPDQQGENAAK